MSVPQDEILVNNGETAVLRCNADGIPPPVISWYKGEEEVRIPLYPKKIKINSKNYRYKDMKLSPMLERYSFVQARGAMALSVFSLYYFRIEMFKQSCRENTWRRIFATRVSLHKTMHIAFYVHNPDEDNLPLRFTLE